MLESMRNHAQGWIAKVILGGICLSFVLWGVGDYFTGGQNPPVAMIGDIPVDQNEYYNAYQRQLNTYRSMLGKQYSPELIESLGLKDNTLQTVINRKIMLKAANDLGLVAPEAVVFSRVASEQAFHSAGNFDPKRYQIITRNMGFGSPQDYEDELRMNIVVDALQKAMLDSVQISDAEIRDTFNRDYEKRVLSAIIVDPDTLKKTVKVDEAAAKSWYEGNKERYQSPLRVKLNLVEINQAELAADIIVDDADVRAAYEEKKADFTQDEQRNASHILIKVKGDASQEVRLEARAKIEAVQKRLKAGEDFASVAKEVSQDNTAERGGDLGWFKQGAMVTAFDQAVFSMEKGEQSDIVETEFGYHLIKLAGVRAAKIQSFESVQALLRGELLKKRVADEAYNLSQDLDDALGMEDSLKAAADSLNLKQVTIGPVSLTEAIAQPLLADEALRNKIFSTLPGQAVEIHVTESGRFVAVEVVERIEPDVLPFDQAAGSAMADAKADAAMNEARKIAEQIRAEKDASMDALAQKYGQAKFISKPVRSNGEGGEQANWLTSEVLEQAFSTAKGSWLNQIIEVNQGMAVVRVESVTAASDAEFEAQKAEIEKQALQAKGSARFSRWMASMRDRYEITVNEDILARLQ